MEQSNFLTSPGKKVKLSADFIFSKLISVVAIIFFASEYLKERKGDGLYEIPYFLAVILFGSFLIYEFTRPRTYYDNSILYYKRINTKEIQIPLNVIHTVKKKYSRRGVGYYEVEYDGGGDDSWQVGFHCDSFFLMEEFVGVVKEVNPSVHTIGIFR